MSNSASIVLVTGCSEGGIGFFLCEEFAAQGCKVYATARRVEAMESLKHESIERLKLDVTDGANVEEVVKAVLDREGRIDVLFNNAGIPCHGPLVDIPIERFTEVFDTNATSVMRMVKAVFPSMAARKSGKIVNVGSIVGDVPTPWSGAYSASKAALKSISETLYMECAPFGVSVTHIAPGGVKSHVADNSLARLSIPPDSLYAGWLDKIIARINASKSPKSMATDEFARRVVKTVLSPKPPQYMTLGENAWLFRFFGWLPRTLALAIMWYVTAGKPKSKAA
ncbi:NAD(P)-binding protein [Laetiporus sulphureus 93-53]|uniref:NAD(P)-binding protein n=1 Tax=Laetiporus sulphureus 93-53 TaxID=1314785 RepID=A0A165F7Q7_9APHY|nr:NAD(P)-binding protein [Laetiporus sulphureus 93-53]KZT08552.1 NAD(P)-binding protein [Laetiporus sulphureus 93-53]